jgi:hypothetical protein
VIITNGKPIARVYYLPMFKKRKNTLLNLTVEMEDEDYALEEEDEEEEEMRINSNNSPGKGGILKAVYPEGFGRPSSSNSPRFASQNGFTRYDLNSAPSPVHGWGEAIDEKGDSMALLMQLEKSVIHQKFFNSNVS